MASIRKPRHFSCFGENISFPGAGELRGQVTDLYRRSEVPGIKTGNGASFFKVPLFALKMKWKCQ